MPVTGPRSSLVRGPQERGRPIDPVRNASGTAQPQNIYQWKLPLLLDTIAVTTKPVDELEIVRNIGNIQWHIFALTQRLT